MNETEARDILGNAHLLIRFILTGAVVLLMLAFTDQLGVRHFLSGAEWWKVLGLTAVLGGLSYSFYMSVFEHYTSLPFVLKRLHRRRSEYCPPYFKDCSYECRLEMVHILALERWARHSSDTPIVKAAQRGLDRSYDWMVFMYCTGLLLLAAGVVILCGKTFVVCSSMRLTALLWFLVSGVGLLIFGGFADFFLTGHELWLAKHYPQFSQHKPESSRE